MSKIPAILIAGLAPGIAQAAGADAPVVDGAALGLAWAIPFAGILLSIALFPLFAGHVWEHHYGKIAAAWALAFIVPFTIVFGIQTALYTVLHTLLLEYIPFIILLFALFAITGGIRIKGGMTGSPLSNTTTLAVGALVASWAGTTGASMLFIRPMIRANRWRENNQHVFIFFIFLVSNMGGVLTPLGDPPLFIGFLRGVDFFWTTSHLFSEMLVVVVPLLAVFYVLDRYRWRRESAAAPPGLAAEKLGIEGWINIVLLGAVVGAVLLSATWRPGWSFEIFHNTIEAQDLARDVLLVVIALVSMRVTPAPIHASNEFSWGPMQEVAKLFIAIFLTIAPVIAILKAGREGVFSGLVALTSHADATPNNAMYFWLSGLLSSFLDNAPTYLVFFELAGGEPQRLMHQLPVTLAAISCGAVFMGANSYIGNAPNFMVKAVCESRGVKMPSFFGYCGWALIFLVPLYVLITVIFFR